MRHLIVLPGGCMLLFKAMPMGWVMAWTTKLRKYTQVHNTVKLLKWRNTHCRWTYKWVRIYKTCWFEFWQPSDLIRGLGVCPILSYLAIQEVESFFSKIYGSTPACSIDESQPTMLIKGMAIEKLPTIRGALFSQRALSQWDSSLVTRQLAAPKSTQAWHQGVVI